MKPKIELLCKSCEVKWQSISENPACPSCHSRKTFTKLNDVR